MLVIVNADDLGASETVNNKIFELMEQGLVTSASIISNAPAFEHAVENIYRFPNCSFGVHLNLTVFKPLTRSHYLERILSEDGSLSEKIFGAPFSKNLTNALQMELIAQVQRVVDFGITISHFDSHQHIHTMPQLFIVLKSLQRQFGILRVRNTINLLPPGQRMSIVRHIKKIVFSIALRKIWSTRSAEGFCGFSTFYKIIENGTLPHLSSIELMVHPGTTYEPYNAEVELLKSSNWMNLTPNFLKLDNYYSL
ncbi:MAG: ChbG/HpnK family deacetylase [Desulfuromonadaceae bacterium]|nr:ChbG/HpnK family deacetylase [Desulfuromonadaceae bacterium]MDD5104815.1 ChbG/HpnK family deacetylase [Desulfuromonadaceae bacterium]